MAVAPGVSALTPETFMRRTPTSLLACAGLLSLALLRPNPAAAAWPSDPLVNVPLCTASGDQTTPTVISDEAGGAIITWADNRSGNRDMYAQRISADGVPQWTADGVALCTASGDQSNPVITPDGTGGAIVTWHDIRGGNYDIYAQRISAAGAVQWTADGVALCAAGGHQTFPAIATDGAGGAIVSWFDYRGLGYDIYAQRISAAGAVQWTGDGVALCTAAGFQEYPALISDGAGGAIVAWFDQRTGGNYTYADIFAQRVSAAGTPLWATDGVALCTATGSQQNPTLTSDGAGGAIVAWFDYRAGNYDIYAQRVSSAGAVQWTADGIALCTAAGEQAYPTIAADALGGAYVTWRDYRSGSEYDIYAQRISAAGAPQWTAGGAVVCNAIGDQYDPAIIPDGTGGAILTWPDNRAGFSLDIHAQRLSPTGAPRWTANGVALCTAPGGQNVPMIASQGTGGAIVTWHDPRGGGFDIYAQRVQANGQLGGDLTGVTDGAPLSFALHPVSPNPARGSSLNVSFTLASAAGASLELLDVLGRRIVLRELGSLGSGSHVVRLSERRSLSPGMYLVRLRQGANTRSMRVAIVK